MRLAWEASSKSDLKEVNRIVAICVETYAKEAKSLQAELTDFPQLAEAKKYQVLNDVGTCLFIHAELLMNMGQTKQCVEAFKNVIQEYPLSQAWDPSRGSYWSISEKSQSSIDNNPSAVKISGNGNIALDRKTANLSVVKLAGIGANNSQTIIIIKFLSPLKAFRRTKYSPR